MTSILKLIRWKNLIMILVMQLLLKYALFHPFGIDITLNGFGFGLLIFATLCLAAAGNIINDIYDVDGDSINKPDQMVIGKSMTEKAAFNWFVALNIIGVGIGFYLSNLVGRSGFTIIFVGISILLYLYASSLKHILIIKNLIISVLVAMAIIIVGLFDLMPAITSQNQETQLTIFKIVLDYAMFAFGINLVREIVKDHQDIKGDQSMGLNTLPIALGENRSKYVALALLTLFIAGIAYYVVTFLYKQELAVGYFAVFVIAPLIYAIIKLFGANNHKDYAHISMILKVVMFLGMLSLLIYPFVLK